MIASARLVQQACSQCALAHLCLPYGLDSDEIARLESQIIPDISIKAGHDLFVQGDPLAAFYAITEGGFKTAVFDTDGLEQIMGFYFAGDLLGLDALGDETHRCTATAIENGTVCRLPFDQIDNLLTQLPSLRRRLMRLMSRALTDEEHQLLTLGRKSSEGRVATVLLDFSQRLAMRNLDSSIVPLNMKRTDLANYLGMRVETISRVLGRFQSKGILNSTRKEVEIHDWLALRAYAGSGAWVADQ